MFAVERPDSITLVGVREYSSSLVFDLLLLIAATLKLFCFKGLGLRE
jgi:hypothetical protein